MKAIVSDLNTGARWISFGKSVEDFIEEHPETKLID